jgi:hypothetical protein
MSLTFTIPCVPGVNCTEWLFSVLQHHELYPNLVASLPTLLISLFLPFATLYILKIVLGGVKVVYDKISSIISFCVCVAFVAWAYQQGYVTPWLEKLAKAWAASRSAG